MEKMKPNKVYRIRVGVSQQGKRELEEQLGRRHKGQAPWRVLYAVTVLTLLAALLVTTAMCGARASEQEGGQTSETEQVTGKLEIPSAELLYAIEAMEKILPPQVSVEVEPYGCAFEEKASAWDDVPMTDSEIAVMLGVCEEHHIAPALALGLIQVESSFRADALNRDSGCYGYCQLNPQYFPAELSPEENIRVGLEYLASKLEKYDNLEAALTAYYYDYDSGDRTYAEKVLAAAERWR